MTLDPKPKQPLNIDFVARHSVDECSQRLTEQDAWSRYRAYVGEEGRFTVEWGQRRTWPQSSDAGIMLTFVGYLEPNANGTRVHGSVTKGTRTTIYMMRQVAIILTIITAILFIASAVITVPGGITTLTVVGLGCVGLGIYAYVLHHQMGQLVPWVENKLSGMDENSGIPTEKEET